jgi:hypothetical protein
MDLHLTKAMKYFAPLTTVLVVFLMLTNLYLVLPVSQSEELELESMTFKDEGKFDNKPTFSSINEYRTRGENGPRMDNVTYAIITPGQWTEVLEPLAEWKTQKGVPAEIFELGWITSNYDGRDKAEKIHNFLIDLNWKTPQLKWLLLVGDSEIIPPRYVMANASSKADINDTDNYVPTDYYYAGLRDNWDADNDGIYGELNEPDWTPNVYVGRLPVNNLTEVNYSVNRILDYEQNPPIGNWSKTGLLCSGLMDVPNIVDDEQTEVDEGYNWYKDNAYEATQKILKYVPTRYEIKELTDYTYQYGGYYDRKYDTLNYTSCTRQFDEGASIVSFISHGWTNGDGVTHYSGTGVTSSFTGYFNYDDGYNSNNSDKLPIMYVSSCNTGDFTENDDTNFEQLLYSPTGGAIGVIAATVSTYRGEFEENDTSFGNWWLAENFWNNFFNGYPKPGENLYELKEAYYEHINSNENPHKSTSYFKFYRTNLLAYNLLGDPELSIHTDIVGELDVTHPTELEVVERDLELDFYVKTKDTDDPVQNADICLNGNGIYKTISTDKYGKATISFRLVHPGKFNITITAQNFLPYTSSIKIKNYIDLALNENEINFSQPHPAAGDDIIISAKIHNFGKSNATSVTVRFYDGLPLELNGPGFQIGNNITIPDLGPNRTVTVSTTWLMPEGTHAVYCFIDPEDLILESNEDNNYGYKIIIENLPPQFSNLPEISVNEDTIGTNIFNLTSYTFDPDTTELEYMILKNPNPDCNVSISQNEFIQVIPAPNWTGKTTIEIQVFDGASTDVSKLVINIKPINDPPVIEPIDNLTAVEDELFKFQVQADDIDSQNIYFVDSTELFDIDPDTGLISFVPTNEDVGVHNITISASDGDISASHSVTFFLTIININDKPTLTLTSVEWNAKVDEIFTFKVQARDIDVNDKLTFSDNTDLFDIDPLTGEINFKPSQDDEGKHKIRISVSDGNSTISQEIILVIEGDSTGMVFEYALIVSIIILIIIVIMLLRLKSKLKPETRDNDRNGDVEEDTEDQDEDENNDEDIDVDD